MQNKVALVVDDSRVARMTLARLLQSHGFEVVESGSGEEAISYLQTAQKPAVVFMDVMMDGMDGLSATRQIKAIPDLQPLPVVICTGNDTEADRESALATGAMAVLSKPPAAEAVNAIVDKLASLALAEAEKSFSEPQQAVVDEAALLNKALNAVEQHLLPQLTQQVRHIAEDISRQIAAEAAEAAVATHGRTMLPEWTQQVTDSARGLMLEMKETVSQQLTPIVNKVAMTAINSSIEHYGLSEKIMVMLRSEGSQWLKQQEQALRSELIAQLRQELEPMVNRYLEASLTQKITPLINSNVEEMLATLTEQQQSQLETLQQDVKQLRMLNIGITIIAVAALVVALL